MTRKEVEVVWDELDWSRWDAEREERIREVYSEWLQGERKLFAPDDAGSLCCSTFSRSSASTKRSLIFGVPLGGAERMRTWELMAASSEGC